MYSTDKGARIKSDEDVKIMMRDQNVPWTWNLTNTTFEKFASGPGKFHTLGHSLNWEHREKYIDRYSGRFKAHVELGSLPECFDFWVKDLDDTSLDPKEKNCMKDCYFKRLNAKNDYGYFFLQQAVQKKMDLIRMYDM